MWLRKLCSLALLVCLGASCDTSVEVANSAPRLTWISVAAPVDGISDVTVWISDIEGDAVDVALTWRQAGAPTGGTEIAQGPGGHGLVGLATHLAIGDPTGQAHLIRWDTTGISGSVELRLAPNDQEASGVVALSPSFDVSTGIPEAVDLIESL